LSPSKTCHPDLSFTSLPRSEVKDQSDPIYPELRRREVKDAFSSTSIVPARLGGVTP
jgi:hypothetical protein